MKMLKHKTANYHKKNLKLEISFYLL